MLFVLRYAATLVCLFAKSQENMPVILRGARLVCTVVLLQSYARIFGYSSSRSVSRLNIVEHPELEMLDRLIKSHGWGDSAEVGGGVGRHNVANWHSDRETVHTLAILRGFLVF